MTAEQLKAMIASELKVEPTIEDVWGLDMNQCLIDPIKQKYKSSNDATEIDEFWTVLEERKDRNGYKIFYDEKMNKFGLAVQSDTDELINVGYYGSFLETVHHI